jgi:hypothetical protein
LLCFHFLCITFKVEVVGIVGAAPFVDLSDLFAFRANGIDELIIRIAHGGNSIALFIYLMSVYQYFEIQGAARNCYIPVAEYHDRVNLGGVVFGI